MENDQIAISDTRPTDDRLPVELAVYDMLEKLGVSYLRADHSAAWTMEDCIAVDNKLGVVLCKNLFLCNRQKTVFYLLLMPADKEFRTKDLSAQINSARLSFASAESMQELLGVTPGSVSVMGLMNDSEHRISLLIDKELLSEEFFGCHPCINTSSIRISTADLTGKILPFLGYEPTIVEL